MSTRDCHDPGNPPIFSGFATRNTYIDWIDEVRGSVIVDPITLMSIFVALPIAIAFDSVMLLPAVVGDVVNHKRKMNLASKVKAQQAAAKKDAKKDF